jgi:hypothetical protein
MLDGKPISFENLILKAKQYGYYSPGGFYCTSEAARILRENGFIVEDK